MKHVRYGVAVLALLLSGCAKMDFQPYEGPGTLTHGLGGSHVRKAGIDVWTNGAPPRPYQLLGIVERDGSRHSTDESLLRECIEIARRNGGQAIMVLDTDSRVAGVGIRSGGRLSRPHLRAAVIRYL